MTMLPAAHQTHSNKHRSHQQPWRQSQNHASCCDQEHLINCSNLVSSCSSDESILFGGANHIHMSYGYSNYSCYYCDQSCLGSEFLVESPHGQMADHHHHQQRQHQQLESRTNSINNEAAASTSSKDRNADRAAEAEEDEGWLQLTIGSHTHGCHEQQLTSAPAASQNVNRHFKDDREDIADQAHQHYAAEPTTMISSTCTDSGLVELDLIPSGPGGTGSRSTLQLVKTPFYQLRPIFHQIPETLAPPRPVINYDYARGREGGSAAASASASSSFGLPTSSSTPYSQQAPRSGSSSVFLPQEINWTRTPLWPAVASPQYSMGLMPSSLSSSSSSSAASFSSLSPLGSFFARPLQFQFHAHAAGPSSDIIRVVDPPRRPHSGLWFILQASQNQVKEPFLPQISKSFLRIKDGRMTVRLVMKYLANKFKLDSETEIEIRCRGEELAGSLTLQHVRDNIWSGRDAVTLLQDSSSTDHVMTLHYARRTA